MRDPKKKEEGYWPYLPLIIRGIEGWNHTDLGDSEKPNRKRRVIEGSRISILRRKVRKPATGPLRTERVESDEWGRLVKLSLLSRRKKRQREKKNGGVC